MSYTALLLFVYFFHSALLIYRDIVISDIQCIRIQPKQKLNKCLTFCTLLAVQINSIAMLLLLIMRIFNKIKSR